MRRLGIIGGTNADFGFEWSGVECVATPYGAVDVWAGSLRENAVQVRFIKRHGDAHQRLSSMVAHRANVWALHESGCSAVVGTTVCGVIDAELPLATAIVFDDLYFPDNRLPDGSPCTFFDTPGAAGRGHHIFGSPFSASMRSALVAAAGESGVAVCDGGTYAYSLGPRFNTRAEIAAMRAAGACAVSQTAGPEAVLAGELELPYALVGFGVDYANGVQAEPTPVDVLDANIVASKAALQAIVTNAAAALAAGEYKGFVYRFE